MLKLLRIIWAVILLASVAWIALGLAAWAGLMPSEGVFDSLTAQAGALASQTQADQIEGYTLPGFIIGTGLPFFVIAGFLFWVSSRWIHGRRASSKHDGAEEAFAIPMPFPDGGQKPKRAAARGMRRQGLVISLLAFAAVFVLWNNREFEMLLYPLRLFVTFIHEAGHVVAALLSGGRVGEFVVNPNGSGYATVAGGNNALILPAGYLGAALFGSLLFLLSNRLPRWLPVLGIALGIFMIGITILYARPDGNGLPLALLIGVGFGLVLVLLGAMAPHGVNQFIISTLAVLTALKAVLDLWFLIGNSGAGMGDVRNDAAVFAQEITPLLPASVIAFIWAGIAVGMMGFAVYYGTIKPLRREISDAVTGES